jgi:2-amino-4-hydroxy-6-hydroxymethyldihydropteridine diphosphokinase
MYIAYLLLGSNLGDRLKFISEASGAIDGRLGSIQARSSLYRTASWGKHDQPDFINMAVALETELSAAELLKGALSIEMELGRERVEKWGSRTIDIDILLYGDQIINQPDLKIPHPFLHERRFCLEPLVEIASDLIHPSFGKPLSVLLRDLLDNLSVKKLT